MDKLFEILLEIIPVLITGIITFYITRYTVKRNFPLDKMEIAYNRIYYPMYLLIKNKTYSEINHQEVQNKMNYLIKKYDKYFSQSTTFAYREYEKNINTNKQKRSYSNFSDNIFYYNSKLRFTLGYPQATILESIKYLDRDNKRLVSFAFALIFLYPLSLLYNIFPITYIMYGIALLLLYLLLIFVLLVSSFIYNKIYKLINYFKHHN